jgi:pilus assembly protein TadC
LARSPSIGGPCHGLAGREIWRSFIRIAATIAAFAVLWYASFRIVAVSRGAANVIAKAAFLILTSLACIAIGFFLPVVPVVSAVLGSAFWAGLLATAGTLAGMALSDAILARLETRQSDISAGEARSGKEKLRPPL